MKGILVAAVLTAVATGCAAPAAGRTESVSANAAPTVAAAAGISKILVIPEENHSFSDVIGASAAPYLTGLSQRYGLATNYVAGDPTSFHSLASYLMMTAGTPGIGVRGSDCSPAQCPQPEDNIFHQLLVAGKRWGVYAESMTKPCDPRPKVGTYAVRHTAAPYFNDLASSCTANDVPMGSMSGGALAKDVAAGQLPAFGMAVPNLNDDMHDGSVAAGDHWMSTWLPTILRGADYRAGRLAIVITWDEGRADNHVATIVVGPQTQHVTSAVRYDHYSLLRTCEEILHLPLLGGARQATSMRTAFRL